jgi:hypothetical protein
MTTIPNETNPSATAADTPQPDAMLTPEEVVDQLRVMRSRIAAVSPLTTEQRRMLRQQSKVSDGVLQSSINVIGASDHITAAVGQPAGEVRQMVDDSNRWTAVEDELRATLNGVAGANLVRRQRLALIAAQAYTIGKQLARDPENAALVPHLAEIRRLRAIARRRKQRTPQTPVPPAPVPNAPFQQQAVDASPAQPQVPETAPAADTSMTPKA